MTQHYKRKVCVGPGLSWFHCFQACGWGKDHGGRKKTAHLSADREAEREREGCRGEKKGMVRGGVGREQETNPSTPEFWSRVLCVKGFDP